ncbi:MAG: hypothetical protein ACO36I_21290 [Candidatus Latescibacterota bacterium]
MQYRRVEFFGLPGVGKTHLTNLLCQTYPDLETFVLPNKPATWYEKIYDYPFHFKYFRLFQQVQKEPEYKKILTRLKRIARRKPYIRQNTHCILLECGLLQPTLEAIMLHKNIQEIAHWQSFLDDVIFSDQHYIYITDQIETIVHREYTRANRRFTLDSNTLLKCYTSTIPIIEYLKAKTSFTQFDRTDYPDDQLLIKELYRTLQNVLSLPTQSN